jgi:hypothetical protein
MKVHIVVLFVLLLFPFFASAQGFTNATNDVGVDVFNTSPTLGFGVSFFDFDHDGWDDLSFCQENDSLVFYKNIEGTFVQMPSLAYASADSKHITWADYDNDGDSDLLVTQYLGFTRLYRNDGDWSFTDVTLDAGIPQQFNAKTFGVSWADYDRDGWLDVYMCNFNWNDGTTNWCLHNNGDGTFTDMAVDLGIDNGSKPSYQSTWLDYNNDNWPDLYVINDFLPKNALYENNGDGTFTDISTGSGTDLNIEAMSNAPNDYDNDGDLDIYITNNTAGNYLLKNQGGGTFTNEAVALGVTINDLCWGSLWIDYDNDGWDDLYVATSFGSDNYLNHFFSNNEGIFTSNDAIVSTADQAISFSNAKGDFNNDGFYDIVQANASSQHSFVYENQTSGNNYIKVNLEGTTSNRDAVGSWLETYIAGQKFVEYTHLGQNFLGQNSQHLILPLGQASQVDSLFIKWPNGLIEAHYDVSAGNTYNYVEGSTVVVATLVDGPSAICSNETTSLSVGGQFVTVEWSSGDFGNTLIVDEPGTYFATVTDANGYSFMTESVEIEALQAATPITNIVSNSCFGEMEATINLTTEDIAIVEIMWESGQDSTYIDQLSSGWHTYSIVDENSCTLTDSVEIVDPIAIEFSWTTLPPTCNGYIDGSIELSAEGGTGNLDYDFNGILWNEVGAGIYPGTITDENDCEVSLEIEVTEPEQLTSSSIVEESFDEDGSIVLQIEGGTDPYSILWNTGDIDVETLTDLPAGTYSAWIIDAYGCTIFTEIVVAQIVSVEEEKFTEFILYPNPANHQFTIEFSDSQSGIMKLIDAQGKCVKTQLTSGTSIIRIDGIVSGLYTVTWTSEQGSWFAKPLLIK